VRILDRPRVHALLFIGAIALPRAAAAEPIVITSGVVESEVLTAYTRFTIAGDGFALTGWAEAYSSSLGLSCTPCTPGATLDLGGVLAGPRAAGSGVVDGVTYSQIFLDGMTGTFSSPSFQIAGNGDITVSRDFSFSGTVNGYVLDPFVYGLTEPVFTKTLFGRGTATAEFLYSNSEEPLFMGHLLRYEFAGASPTPEPASVVLLASGAAMVALRRRLTLGR
jgi:hypothetical protein